MELKASIDIGSNSILLLAAKVSFDDFEIILNESFVTGLGRGLDETGSFSEIAMEESYEALSKYKELCEGVGINPKDVIVTATEATRVAKNAKGFIDKIKNELGFEIQIISGLGEAFYSCRGVLFDKSIQESHIVIMDIGGASTEFIKVNVSDGQILNSFSTPVGVVRMTNWREKQTEEKNLESVFSQFAQDLDSMQTSKLYCVAGTMTSIANMLLGHKEFVEEEVHGFVFPKDDLQQLIEMTQKYEQEEFLAHYPFLGKRSHTIKAGLKLALSVFDRLTIDQAYVSTYGLRYGTLIEGRIKDEYVWKK